MRLLRDPFDILGIEATTDRKRIKRAYAERVKTVHPEEDPKGWKLLYDAYQAAMQMAEESGPFRPGEGWEQAAPFSPSGEESLWQAGTNLPKWADTDIPEPDDELRRAFYDIHDRRSMDLIDAKGQIAALFVYDGRRRGLISEGASKEQKWDLFFTSDLFERLKQDEAFWEMLQDTVQDSYVDKGVCQEIQRKLLELLKEEQPEHCRKRMTRIMTVLPDRIVQKKFSIRNYSRRTIVGAAVWILVYIALFVWRVMDATHDERYDLEAELTAQQVQAEMANHLNEKYGTDIYDAEDFIVSMTAPYDIYRYGTDGYVHRVKMADNPDFEGCIVEYEDGEEARGFDNLQGSQIEAALKDELISQGVMSQGRMTLYETEEYSRLWQPEEEAEPEPAAEEQYRGYPVYHTLYEEETGIQTFVTAERELRMVWLHYEELPENLEGPEDDRWCIDMGRITIYAPDSAVASISDWVTGKKPGGAGTIPAGMVQSDREGGLSFGGADTVTRAETLSKQTNAWEKEFGMRISMVAMPQSLYEKIGDLERLPCLDDVTNVELSGIVSGKWNLQAGGDFGHHLSLPYGASWHMWATGYTGSVQEADEDIWIETAGDGNGGCKLQMKPEENGNGLQLQVTSETKCCIVLILSEEALGIDGGHVTVFRQEAGKEKTEMPCADIRSYFSSGNDSKIFSDQHQTVLREEGYLLIPYMAGDEKNAAEILITQ